MTPSETALRQEADLDQQLADVLAEVAARLQAGQSVDLSEYVRRCPEHADRIEQLLPAMKTLADLGRSRSSVRSSVAGAAEPVGTVERELGDFRILREIGRGGMGVVYEAQQISLGRRVALKVLPFAAVLDPRHLQRFKNEAQAAAALEHPNIVNVHAVGCERGVHYYAMQYIDGQTLAQVIHQLRETTDGSPAPSPQPLAPSSSPLVPHPSPLTPSPPHPVTPSLPAPDTSPKAAISTQRSHRTAEFFRSVAQLGIQAAEALEHAHQMGVVHRDIKPSNLMVSSLPSPSGRGAGGEGPHLWITDFGLALTHTGANLTMTGDILGTLRYMSPEQAAGKSRVLDHHTDIYSLGLTLYELLTLRPAFEGDDRQRLLCRIVADDPPPPRQHNPSIPRDLETIVLKATAKEPSQRYASAQQMADDLRRYLDDKPIRARRPSLVERAGKWARRHRPAVRAAAAALVTLLGALITSMVLIAGAYESEKEQRGLAVEQKDDAFKQKEEAQRQRDAAEGNLYLADVRLGWQDWRAGHVPRLYEMLQKYLPESGRRDLRAWEWYYLLSLCHQEQTILRDPAGFATTCMAWNPTNGDLATGNNFGHIRIWDPASAKELFTLPGSPLGVGSLAWSPDGDFLAAASGEDVRIWDIRSRVQTNRWADGEVDGLCWSPDGKCLAYTHQGEAMKIWSIAEGKLLRTWPIPARCSTAWSPDGKYLAAAEKVSQDDHIRIWDPQTGRELRSWQAPGCFNFHAIVWSPDASRLATGTYSQHFQVWETGTWRKLLDIPHSSGIDAVAWSPDGRYLASGTRGAEAILWDARTGEKLNVLRGHLDWVRSIAWSPDSERLATLSADGVIKIGDPKKIADAASVEHARVRSFTWSADGSRLATAGGGKVKIWDAPERRELASWDSSAKYCALHPDGKRLALKHIDKKVEVVDAATGRVELTVSCGDQVDGSIPLDWSPDGTKLAFAFGVDYLAVDAPESVIVHDIVRNKTIATLRGHTQLVWVVRWSPDGKRLASAGWDGTVRVWDAATGKGLVTFQGHPRSRWLAGLAWSPDGKRIASAGWDQTIEVWDSGSGKEVASLRGHTSSVYGGLDWSPDGKRLASASADGTVKLWNTETWEEVLSMETDGGLQVRWSPNGKQLAVAGRSNVKIWDAAPGFEFAQSRTYPLERAGFLARRGRFDEARGLLEKWIAEYPSDPTYRTRLVAIHFNEGRSQVSRGDAHRAVAAFSEVLRLDQSVGAYFFRAQAYREMGESDKALADYGEAIRLDPKDAAAYNNRGEAYLAKGAVDEGLRDLARAIELNGDDLRIWRRLAGARLAAGKLDEYRATCSAMLERFAQPENPEEARATAWTCVLAPDAVGDWSKAVVLAEMAQKRDPKSPLYHLALGAVLYRAGRFEEAVKHLAEADRLVPEPTERGELSPAETWFFLAMAHHRAGHAEEAKKWLDKATAWTDKALREEHETPTGPRLDFYRRVMLKRFRAEAEDLLGITAKPPAGKEKPEKAK